MTKTEYLYGVKANELKDMQEALNDRIEKANILLKKLVHDDDMKDSKRIAKVLEAIKWCEKMLKEYEN